MIRKVDIEIFMGSFSTWLLIGAQNLVLYIVLPLVAVLVSRFGGWLFDTYIQSFLQKVFRRGK